MTAYHLKFWSNGRGLSRIYVNAADRSSLGHIERRMITADRATDSYYDRHRIAKGDMTEVVSDTVTSTLPAGVEDRVVEAIRAHTPAYAKAALTDPMDRFFALDAHSRGHDWFCDKTRKAELRRMATLTIEIEA
jgi:hypothetical protein